MSSVPQQQQQKGGNKKKKGKKGKANGPSRKQKTKVLANNVGGITVDQFLAIQRNYENQKKKQFEEFETEWKAREQQKDKELLARYRAQGADFGNIGNFHLAVKNATDITKYVDSIRTFWNVEEGKLFTYTRISLTLKQQGAKGDTYRPQGLKVNDRPSVPDTNGGSVALLGIALKSLNIDNNGTSFVLDRPTLAKKFDELQLLHTAAKRGTDTPVPQ